MNNLYVNNICIGLLSTCNWNCKYCIARQNNEIINEENIINQIIPIKYKLKNLVLSGGEPGILSINFWDKIFSLTEYKLGICTNGTFIINGFHERYRSKIRILIIHCVKEIDQDINPVILDFVRNDKIPYEINIVIHKKNSHLIKSFLDKYNDINFMMNFTDSTFIRADYEYAIDREAALEIVKQLSYFKNYGEYSSKLVRCIIRNNFRFINDWSPENKTVS